MEPTATYAIHPVGVIINQLGMKCVFFPHLGNLVYLEDMTSSERLRRLIKEAPTTTPGSNTLSHFQQKFLMILELSAFAENAFRVKLRSRNPCITAEEEAEAVTHWYRSKPLMSESDPDLVTRDWKI
jgi:hypothetical protein